MQIIPRERLEPLVPQLKTFCIIAAIGFTGLLLSKDLYFYTWVEKRETIIYSIPMVFLFFMWIKYRLDEKDVFQHQMLLIDITAVFLSAARILGLFWHSGHALFILYTFLTSKSKAYQILCIPFIMLTIGVKVYWSDILTPTLGIIIAVALFVIRQRLENKIKKTPNNG